MKIPQLWRSPVASLLCAFALSAGALASSACSKADAEAGALEKPTPGVQAPATTKVLTLAITGMT